MKKIFFSFMLVLGILGVVKAQGVSVSITYMNIYQGGSGSIPSCGTIAMGTNEQMRLVFEVQLSKAENQFVGHGNVRVAYRVSPTSPILPLMTFPVNKDLFTTSYFQPFDVTLDAFNFPETGAVFFAEYISEYNVSNKGCNYPITRTYTPTFALQPASSAISCGSTAPVTFSVSNVYNSSGTLTYNWQIGSGWLYNGTPTNGSTFNSTSSSIQLIPASYPPGSVTVTPILNNVSQPQKTVSPTLAAYNPTVSIVGNGSGCLNTGSNYSLNLNPGNVSYIWYVTDPASGTVTNPNAATATFTPTQNGTATLNVRITNSCGQHVTKSKTIHVGSPTVPNPGITGGYDNQGVDSSTTFSISAANATTNYYWFFTTISSNCPSGGTPPRFYNGSTYSTTLTTTSQYATVKWGTCPGNYVVNCRALNSCGSADVGFKIVNVYSNSGGGGGGTDPCPDIPVPDFRIYPNPVKASGTSGASLGLTFKPAPPPPCDNPPFQFKIDPKKEVKIYDMFGRLVFEGSMNEEEASFNDLNLVKGNYVVSVATGGKSYRKIIAVE